MADGTEAAGRANQGEEREAFGVGFFKIMHLFIYLFISETVNMLDLATRLFFIHSP